MQRALIILALIAVVASAQGQGRVTINNNSSSLITTNSMLGGPPTGPISGPVGSYYFAAFYAPLGTANPSLFVFTGAYGTNVNVAGFPGRFIGPDAVIAEGNGVTRFSFLVRGWSANIGSDVSAVQSYLANPTFTAWYGESRIGSQLPIPGNEGPFASVFGGPDRILGFNLNMYPAVPEPSSVVLGILGGAALFFFRHCARH